MSELDQEPGSNWICVGGQGADPTDIDIELINEAQRAAPPEVRAGGLIMPRRQPTDSMCRLCGVQTTLSREHVPPRSAGNSDRVRSYTINEWLGRESLDEIPGGKIEQGGVWGFTLCGCCNSRTGRLSHSYRRTAAMAARMFAEDLPSPAEMNHDEVLKMVKIRIERMQPGAFTRQVVSLMCSVAGPWDLAERHPEIRSAVLDGTTCAMPVGLTLSMLLCPGPLGLMAGPSLAVDIAAGAWRWVAVLAHPPLAFELELAASENQEASPGCSIGNFLEHHEDVEGTVELELPIGFSNVGFPGDWRSRAQVERGLDVYGRPTTTPTVDRS